MSHTYEKVSGNKAKLTFTIPAEQFDEAMQKAFLKMRGRVNVPGFRKGKAPRSLIERMYGESIFYEDAFDLLFPDAYQAAVQELDLHPVDQPSVDVDEIGAGQDLKFHVEVFVRPDVTLGEYKGLSVEADQQKLTDEMVDARISQDQDKASRTIDVEDRPVQEGDTVNLDYAGTVDGVAFAGGTAENQTLKIGSHQFIEGFEEQMIGMNIGEERDLQVRFPDEYHAEELKGKDAVFHVKVNGIQVTEKPELDDDFAADISEFDTFAAYKDNIVQELTKQIERSNDVALENALVEKAAENAEVDIPQAMIDDQAEYMLREMAMRMSYQGLRMEDYMKYTGQTREDMIAMNKPEAAKRVKAELVIEAIRKAENIEPSEEDVDQAIREQAERSGQDEETFRNNLTDEQKAYLKDNAAIQKVLDLLKKDARIVEKKEEKEEEAEKPAKKTAKKAAAKADDAVAETSEKEKKPARRTTKKTEEAAAEENTEKPEAETREEKPARRRSTKKAASDAE